MSVTLTLTDEQAAHLTLLLHRGARMAGQGTDGYRLAAAILGELVRAEQAAAPQPSSSSASRAEPGA